MTPLVNVPVLSEQITLIVARRVFNSFRDHGQDDGTSGIENLRSRAQRFNAMQISNERMFLGHSLHSSGKGDGYTGW